MVNWSVAINKVPDAGLCKSQGNQQDDELLCYLFNSIEKLLLYYLQRILLNIFLSFVFLVNEINN